MAGRVLDSSGSGQGQRPGCCEHGNKVLCILDRAHGNKVLCILDRAHGNKVLCISDRATW